MSLAVSDSSSRGCGFEAKSDHTKIVIIIRDVTHKDTGTSIRGEIHKQRQIGGGMEGHASTKSHMLWGLKNPRTVRAQQGCEWEGGKVAEAWLHLQPCHLAKGSFTK